MGGKKGIADSRFVVNHADNADFSLLTRSNDGQMMFLANLISKMKTQSTHGSRIAELHNGSSLFTGEAGQGESRIRQWIIENDWLEAIVALPINLFYNTNSATYIWVLSNKKHPSRRQQIQLINAVDWFEPLRKNFGKKNCILGQAIFKEYAIPSLMPIPNPLISLKCCGLRTSAIGASSSFHLFVFASTSQSKIVKDSS